MKGLPRNNKAKPQGLTLFFIEGERKRESW